MNAMQGFGESNQGPGRSIYACYQAGEFIDAQVQDDGRLRVEVDCYSMMGDWDEFDVDQWEAEKLVIDCAATRAAWKTAFGLARAFESHKAIQVPGMEAPLDILRHLMAVRELEPTKPLPVLVAYPGAGPVRVFYWAEVAQ